MKWFLRIGAAAVVVAVALAALMTGHRIIAIATLGAPAIFGSVWLAICHGQRCGYS